MINSPTPTGLPTADIDGGREGRDARKAADASLPGCVNTGRLGARHFPVNLVNVDGGGCFDALPQIVRSLPADRSNSDHGCRHHRAISPESGDEVCDDLSDQARVVLIGMDIPGQPDIGDFSIPMFFIPVHCSEIPDARQ